MSMYELVDRDGDSGMLVVGNANDDAFRLEADNAGRPDERLLTVDPEKMQDPKALRQAALGYVASRQIVESEVAYARLAG